MRHAIILFFLLLPLLLPGVALSATGDESLKAGVFSPSRQAPDFALSGSDGSVLKLSRYRGKVVVLAFGFTSCLDVCPVTLGVLAQARQDLGAQGKHVQIVYVTVDPARDDAERMREYLENFDPTFVGGTGSAEQLATAYTEYGIIANKVANKQVGDAGYSVAHSSYTYLIDRNGNLRALMPYGHSAEDYVHDVRLLLRP